MIKLILFLSITTSVTISGIAVGGTTQQNVSDPQYMRLAWKSIPQINADNSGQYEMVPIKIVSAKTQVVAGVMTVLNVLVGESSCAKQSGMVSSSDCSYNNGGNRMLYEVKDWQKPWENFEEITATRIREVPINENI